jgi:hypothetical protein
MLRARTAVLSVLLGAVVACAHTAPPLTAPSPGPPPVDEVRPFAALYRLDCCHQGKLLATVRGDGESLAVAVAAGPAGTVGEAWIKAGGGWLHTGGERCVRPLTPGFLPLGGGARLPLDPALAARLLAGTLPPEARPSSRGAGWFEIMRADHALWWLVANGVVTRLEAAARGATELALAVTLADHHGRVPGRLSFKAGNESGELALVEWRSAMPPQPPAWASAPPCEEGR